MKNYYPIMLDIKNKNCTVIGGGKVAYRKIISLIECGAKVTVISQLLEDEIKLLAAKKEIMHIQDNYAYKYISDSYIVYAATNDRKINELIYEDCNKRNILVNVVDEPDICNFIVPAKVKRGKLTIAISTNGSSPMLAKKLREDLEKTFDYRYEIFLDIMSKIRNMAASSIKEPSARSKFYKEVIYSDFVDRLNYDSKLEIENEILKILCKYV